MDKPDKKRIQILDSGRKLFFHHGIRRVSVEEICRTAHVSKMTYYKHFDNKVDLACTVLNDLMDDAEKKFLEIMALDVPFSEKVNRQIQLKHATTAEISPFFLDDLYRNPYEEVKSLLERRTIERLNLIVGAYADAQKQGEIRRDIKPEFMLFILNRLIEFADNDELKNIYVSPQEMIDEITKFFFYGISPRSDDAGFKRFNNDGQALKPKK